MWRLPHRGAVVGKVAVVVAIEVQQADAVQVIDHELHIGDQAVSQAELPVIL